jgi:hypothetical protein
MKPDDEKRKTGQNECRLPIPNKAGFHKIEPLSPNDPSTIDDEPQLPLRVTFVFGALIHHQ